MSGIFLLLYFVFPVLSVIGTVLLILASFITFIRGKDKKHARTVRKRIYWLGLILLVGDLWGVCVWSYGRNIAASINEEHRNKISRRYFILKSPFQYGELLIPSGTKISRFDAFDDGEPTRPLELSGLEQARFPISVKVAGVWAIAMETYPGIVELADDQNIKGRSCKKGQLASFDIPYIDYDVVKEFGQRAPDGPLARFKPSQWVFKECLDGPPIALHPGGCVSEECKTD